MKIWIDLDCCAAPATDLKAILPGGNSFAVKMPFLSVVPTHAVLLEEKYIRTGANFRGFLYSTTPPRIVSPPIELGAIWGQGNEMRQGTATRQRSKEIPTSASACCTNVNPLN
jgi:hypothetical protein